MTSKEFPVAISGGDSIFEITDFTVVSDSEQFIATIESIFHECNFHGANATGQKRKSTVPIVANFEQSCNWKHESRELKHPTYGRYMLSHVWPEEISEDVDTDGSKTQYPVATSDLELLASNFYSWSAITSQFGVFEYILITPLDEESEITCDDDLQMFLSALEIATINVHCPLPVFVQFDKPTRSFYVGFVQNENVRTRFETVHTRALEKHRHLSGILDVFKQQLNDHTLRGLEITVAMQLEFIKDDFDIQDDFKPDQNDINELSSYGLPFGSTCNFVEEFKLVTRWPELRAEAIYDSMHYSDIDPYNAPRWKACVTFHKGIKGLLCASLNQAFEFMRDANEKSVFDVLESNVQQPRTELFKEVVNRSAGVNISFGDNDLLISDSILKKWMDEIFTCDQSLSPSTSEAQNDDYEACISRIRTIKGAESHSVIEKLVSLVFMILVQSDNSQDATVKVCLVWKAFVERLREFWENNDTIPGMTDITAPDYSKALLVQKIQMIQCCINVRRKRHHLFDRMQNFTVHDDEFYDANEDFSDTTESVPHENDGKIEPEGRLMIAEDMKLLIYPDQPLYIPITQEQTPMTEDMAEEHAEFLSSLSEGDRLNAQLDTLVSDMQAFKAANPNCCLEDFIRWHSPKDYLEEGGLSERMSSENNIWKTTWDNCRPIAVAHQTRLFNESKIAEQILNNFMYLKLSQLFNYLMPIAMSSALLRILDEGRDCFPLLQADLNKAIHLVTLYCQHKQEDDCLLTINLLQKLECRIGEFKSLLGKFHRTVAEMEYPEEEMRASVSDGSLIQAFVLDLMSSECPQIAFSNSPSETLAPLVNILGAPRSPLALVVHAFLKSNEEKDPNEEVHPVKSRDRLKRFHPTNRKQFVLRCIGARDFGSAKNMPQRLAAFIDGNEVRLCQSLTSDVTFM